MVNSSRVSQIGLKNTQKSKELSKKVLSQVFQLVSPLYKKMYIEMTIWKRTESVK